jgi:hypothetical protein
VTVPRAWVLLTIVAAGLITWLAILALPVMLSSQHPPAWCGQSPGATVCRDR